MSTTHSSSTQTELLLKSFKLRGKLPAGLRAGSPKAIMFNEATDSALIRFGSRLDVYVPKDFTAEVCHRAACQSRSHGKSQNLPTASRIHVLPNKLVNCLQLLDKRSIIAEHMTNASFGTSQDWLLSLSLHIPANCCMSRTQCSEKSNLQRPLGSFRNHNRIGWLAMATRTRKKNPLFRKNRRPPDTEEVQRRAQKKATGSTR